MARRRYYYRRTVRPKQKWAINNVDVRISSSSGDTQLPGTSNALFYQTVVQNGNRVQTGSTDPATSIVSSAQILKCGRFKFRGCIPEQSFINGSPNGYYSTTVFISYVPEGYSITQGGVNDQNIFYQHPEWIIAWTRKDYLSGSQSNEISLTSRLKRNLNTGDTIIVGVMISNTTGTNYTIAARGLLQGTLSYCCRAN